MRRKDCSKLLAELICEEWLAIRDLSNGSSSASCTERGAANGAKCATSLTMCKEARSKRASVKLVAVQTRAGAGKMFLLFVRQRTDCEAVLVQAETIVDHDSGAGD